MTKEEKIINDQRKVLAEQERVEKQELYDEQYKDDLKAGLELLDEEWFIASIKGKYRVINKNDIFIQMSDSDAENWFSNLTVTKKLAGPKEDVDSVQYVYPIWKGVAKRFMGLEFDPKQKYGEIVNENGYSVWNMWTGWTQKSDEKKDCSLYLKHIEENICQGNSEAYEWLLDWMAHIIQKPSEHLDKIPTIKGVQGSGKTTFVEIFQSILGKWSDVIDSDAFDTNFNGIFMNKLLIYADEAAWSGSHRVLTNLKKLSGNKKIKIELKGKDSFTTNNYMRLIITTNSDWSAPVEPGNRRYVSFTCSSQHARDRKYFGAIHEQMENGGREKLMWLLQNRDISQRDWSDVPIFDKEAHEENLLATMSTFYSTAKWLKKCIDRDVESLDNILIHEGKLIRTSVLYDQYKNWIKNDGEFAAVNKDKFSKDMTKYCKKDRFTKGDDKGQRGFWIIENDISINIDIIFK